MVKLVDHGQRLGAHQQWVSLQVDGRRMGGLSTSMDESTAQQQACLRWVGLVHTTSCGLRIVCS
eukprot:1148700-Pelagomonas_calceolata.AAC.1